MEFVLTNARVVAGDEVVAGSVLVRDGVIAAVDGGRSGLPEAIDLEGDWLIPGLVELHTDNLEKHVNPRPGVRWPVEAAVLAHDAQIAASGITTVFDALAVGDIRADSARLRDLSDMAAAVRGLRAGGALRADHALHMRCEVSCANLKDLFAPFADDPLVRLVSVMDHTPGQRQFLDDALYRAYYVEKWNMPAARVDAHIATLRRTAETHSGPNRRWVADLCHARAVPLASHDDATAAHVDEAADLGACLIEFPTTVEAAAEATGRALAVIGGAPNLVRGGSHSGNVPVAALAAGGHMSILSSDYVPASLLHAAFLLHRDESIALGLPAAVATVTAAPARAVGLDDRGVIAQGLRADLVRVSDATALPVVRAVWRAGARVC